jgi:hypothetical protein
VKIDVQNRILFLLDNDAEGISTCRRIRKLGLPANMRAIALPELQCFERFPTHGPNGTSTTSINERAASIECYLDLKAPGLPPAEVRWTSYNRDIDSYQGELVQKESFTKVFLEQSRESISRTGYDVTKLAQLIDTIVQECTSMSVDVGMTP